MSVRSRAAANTLVDASYSRDALPLAQRAVKVAAANPAAHETLGNVFLALNRVHSAQAEYDKTAHGSSYGGYSSGPGTR